MILSQSSARRSGDIFAGTIPCRPEVSRRSMLACLLPFPTLVDAQVPGRQRVGVLENRPEPLNRARIRAFAQVLADDGYRFGGNVDLVYLSADGHAERFPALADELVGRGVGVIVTTDELAARAAKAATASRPIAIVVAGIDPLGAGLLKAVDRRGSNVTGVSNAGADVDAKRVALLKELVPRLRRFAALFNMGNPVNARQWRAVQATARSLRLGARLLDFRRTQDLDRAFETAVASRAEALVIGADDVTDASLTRIAQRALEHRLPSIHPARDYADAGGLLSYGANPLLLYREAAAFVSRILGGAKPADLPLAQATRFQLVINRRSARLLALEIPDDLIVRADAIIY